MLSAGEDTGYLKCPVKDACHLDNLLGCGAVAASPQGVVRLVVKGDVEDGTEIEVESKDTKQLPRQLAVTCDELQVSFVAELAGIRGLIPEELET